MSDLITAEDVKAIRICARSLKLRSASLYDPPGLSSPLGIQVDRDVAGNAEEVADKIERKLSI